MLVKDLLNIGWRREDRYRRWWVHSRLRNCTLPALQGPLGIIRPKEDIVYKMLGKLELLYHCEQL